MGQTIRLVLTFEEAGDVEVDAEVHEFMPGGMGGAGGTEGDGT